VRIRSPPRLATWLLEGLGSDSRIESLIGDLEEQFAEGRSRLWFWRQATGAFALGLLRTLRVHGLSFTAAVFAGCALTSFWILANSIAFRSVYDSLDASRHPWTWDTFLEFMGLRAAQASVALLLFVSTWIVTRIHRAHQRAVLIAFVVAVTARRLPGIAQLAIDGISQSQLPPLLIPNLVRTAIQAVFTLAAGLWIIRRERFAKLKPRIRSAVILTFGLTLVSSLLYDAWRVGGIAYTAAVRYPIDAAEIASGVCLAILLWKRGTVIRGAAT
jgi:hypothetical protein